MRAVAVLAVVAYHLAPARVPGGFTGVDVFFVISGFLITGNLIREAEATGRIELWRFWSRRMRRLLPASLLVLAVCAIATLLFVPGNLWRPFFREIIASALYVENWALAADSVDYLAAENTPSPVQHYWTLSAEEQFYVLTPLLLGALLLVARRWHARRGILLAGLLAVTAASFAWSVSLTATDPSSAYFVTTTRAWEFGAGALLVFAARPRSQGVARVAVVAGLAAVVSAALLLSGERPFPGALALWPVLGAAALIWGGEMAGGWWARISAVRPVRYTGDVSYSIYLWHWPLIVLLPYILGQELGVAGKVGVFVATFVLAGLSTRFVEDPIRFSPRLLGGGRRPRAIIGWSAAAMVAVVGIAGVGTVLAASRAGTSAAYATELVAGIPTPGPGAQGPATPGPGTPPPGSAGPGSPQPGTPEPSTPPKPGECLGALRAANPACEGVLPADLLVPDPAAAPDDTYNRRECFSSSSDELHICSLGPADATVRLAAIGDSHSNQLLAAYERIADARGWRIDVAGHNGCYWTTAVQQKPTQALIDACNAWKVAVTDWLAETPEDYDALLVTMARARSIAIPRPGEDPVDAAVRGLLEAWSTQHERGTRIIAIRDNPAMAPNTVSCVARNAARANDACSLPVARALGERDALVEAVARNPDARLVDLTDVYCPDRRCLVVIGNVVVFADRDHVTATWARTLAPVLADRIESALP